MKPFTVKQDLYALSDTNGIHTRQITSGENSTAQKTYITPLQNTLRDSENVLRTIPSQRNTNRAPTITKEIGNINSSRKYQENQYHYDNEEGYTEEEPRYIKTEESVVNEEGRIHKRA